MVGKQFASGSTRFTYTYLQAPTLLIFIDCFLLPPPLNQDLGTDQYLHSFPSPMRLITAWYWVLGKSIIWVQKMQSPGLTLPSQFTFLCFSTAPPTAESVLLPVVQNPGRLVQYIGIYCMYSICCHPTTNKQVITIFHFIPIPIALAPK